MIFGKPYCELTVKQGKAGMWRWTARDADGVIVAICPVQGFLEGAEAEYAGRRAMRGWRVKVV